MLTQNSVKELLYSLPVEVRFAGFRSSTLELGKAGWDLAISERLDPQYLYHRMTLALRFEPARLYAYAECTIPRNEMYNSMHDPISYAETISRSCFTVNHIGNSIEIRLINTEVGFGANAFSPMDCRPQERESVNLKDLRYFKVANPSVKDLIVDPTQVSELLDLVLRAQKPAIDDIKRREQTRRNYEQYTGYDVNPAHEVMAQIITLKRGVA